ncbi:glycosyltransferase [Streptomyces sp. NPDC057002]|uniref:glycosyltransferase n=1 Tax=Streptomyces sp. NPDC057002 TaxID=3345992 RepID=UPI00362E72D4
MIPDRAPAGRGRGVFLVGTDVDSLGGSQRVLHTLAQGLAERGHRVDLIGIRPSPQPHPYQESPAYRHTTLYDRPPRPGTPVRRFRDVLHPRRLYGRHVQHAERDRARARVEERFRAVEDGYLIIGSPWAADWLTSVRWPHLKGIGQYHESFPQAQASANLRLILRHYPQLEKSVFLSEDDAARFQSYRLPNACVIPNPLPFSLDEPAALDTRRIGAVGRLEAVKRLDRLIDAFAAACADLPDWELHLFGDGPQEAELRRHAQQAGVGERVCFRGSVEDMASAYRELSVVALTSDREGRPMALAEAAGFGVPCVGFDISAGVRELVDHERTGLLVRPGDTAAFADALRRLVSDDALRGRLGAAARGHVASLSLPTVLDRWEELFTEIDR